MSETIHDGDRQRASGFGVVLAVVIVLAVGAMLVAGWFTQVVVPEDQGRVGYISTLYDPPTRSVERAIGVGDGQIFATQAVDPLARRPGLIRLGAEEEAYRYQRGAYGWLGWALSAGGDRDLAPWSLIGLTVASVAALVGLTAEMLRRAGHQPLVALVLLLTPGVVTDLLFIGPEALGATLALLGLGLWCRRPGAWTAIALFAAAGLCRETLLVVPAAVGLHVLLVQRRAVAFRLLACLAPYAVWVAYLRVQVGAWPEGSTGGRLGLVPFAGLVEKAPGWGPEDWAGVVLLAFLGVGGLVRATDPVLRSVLAAHLLLAAVLGPEVWAEAAHCGRVLLPMGALGLLALVVGRVEWPDPVGMPTPDLGSDQGRMPAAQLDVGPTDPAAVVTV